jgi:hypothetical protein
MFSCCSSSKNYRKLFDKLFIEQKKIFPGFAGSAYYSRSQAILDNDFKELLNSEFDTLWMIERIAEVDQSSYSIVWTSARETVISYNVDSNGIILNKGKYDVFSDNLKYTVEKFDTTKLTDNEGIVLGAPRVFISMISDKKIKTYYFRDIE